MILLTEIAPTLHQHLSDPEQLIKIGGWLIVLVVIYIETGFILGMFLPGGDYTLFTAGLLCGTLVLKVPVFELVPSLIIASILGDLTGFYKARWLGSKLFTKEQSRFFKPSYLEKTRAFYDRYGKIAFITGKFLPVIRAIIPMLAGAARFPVARFITISFIGSTLWTTSLTLAGFFIGRQFPAILEYKLLLMFGFIILASVPAIKVFFSKKKKRSNLSS